MTCPRNSVYEPAAYRCRTLRTAAIVRVELYFEDVVRQVHLPNSIREDLPVKTGVVGLVDSRLHLDLPLQPEDPFLLSCLALSHDHRQPLAVIADAGGANHDY